VAAGGRKSCIRVTKDVTFLLITAVRLQNLTWHDPCIQVLCLPAASAPLLICHHHPSPKESST
jgi:hypothetical protein